MIVNEASRALPTDTGVLEVADQFALLGIDADDGQATVLETVVEFGNTVELAIAVGGEVGGELFPVGAERVVHLMEQTGDRAGGDGDAVLLEQVGDLAGGATGPLQASDGIASGVVVEQDLESGD